MDELKRKQRECDKIWGALLVTAVLIVPGVPLVLFLTAPWMEWNRQYWSPLAFNSRAWKESDPNSSSPDHSVRQRMLLDLIKQHKLVGRSKSDIRQLLGEPAQVAKDNCWYYDLAPLGLDMLYMHISFKGEFVDFYKLKST